jgi:hypothetical protein
MNNHLDAHAEAANWRLRIETLEQEIRAAEKVIRDAEARRADLALAVLTGKASESDLRNHKFDVDTARNAVVDKRAICDAARGELAKAEARELEEKKAEALKTAKELMRNRIAAAERFDSACKELQDSFRIFEDIGAALLNIPHISLVPPGVTSMALVENVRAHGRVLEAMPAVVERLVPNLIRSERRGPLAHSERAQWRGFIGG